MIKGHGEHFTKEMAERIIECWKQHKQRNIDLITGLAKEKAPLFDYTTLAATLSVLKEEQNKE